MDSNTPYRLACDRCHAQKLRCRREWSGGGCVRCTKAKVQCLSSPSLRVRRGEDAHQRQQRAAQKPAARFNSSGSVAETGVPVDQSMSSSVTEDLSALMDLDPSATSISDFEASLFDFSWTTTVPVATSAPATEPLAPSLTALPADASASSHSPFNSYQPAAVFSHENTLLPGFSYPSPVRPSVSQPSSTPQSQPRPANQRDLWIRKLSYINIELYQHYVAASPSTHVPASSSLEYFSKSPSSSAAVATPAAGTGEHWRIDQTFIVTLQFLEALNEMVAAASSSTTPHNKSKQYNRPDNGTVLLVFSCHLRLLEIYAALFRNLAASSSSSSSPSSSSPSSSFPHSSSPPPRENTTTTSLSPSATGRHKNSPSSSSSSSSSNIALPPLSLGNFVIGPDSPLHGGMIVHLAELLLARTHDAVGCVVGGGGGDGEERPPSSSSSSSHSSSSPNQQRCSGRRRRADSAGLGMENGENEGGGGENGRVRHEDDVGSSARRRASQQHQQQVLLQQGKRAGGAEAGGGVVRRSAASSSATSMMRDGGGGHRRPSSFLSDDGFWGRLRTTGDIPAVTVQAVRDKEREVRQFLGRVRNA